MGAQCSLANGIVLKGQQNEYRLEFIMEKAEHINIYCFSIEEVISSLSQQQPEDWIPNAHDVQFPSKIE